VEFNFDPKASSRTPLTTPTCEEVSHRTSGRK
jgi:hypothetical protein